VIGDLETWAVGVVARAGRGDHEPSLKIKVTPPGHPNGGWVFDFDGNRVIAQFCVWPNGYTDVSFAEIATDAPMSIKTVVVTEMSSLNDVFDDFLRVITKLEAN
jgi:hypothetical protein